MRARRRLVSPGYKSLSVRKQCEVLEVPRSSLYYQPKGENRLNLELMGIMDRHLTDHPTEGVPFEGAGLCGRAEAHPEAFQADGQGDALPQEKPHQVRPKGIYQAVPAQKPGDRTPQPGLGDRHHPMRKGFMYLTAVMDVYSRKILSRGISNSQDAKWCREVLEEAISAYGRPGIVNSDQGSQYTSGLWVNYLEGLGVRVSMDGKGRALDNIYIERFWKSIKYDYVYLNPSEDGFDLWEGVKRYMDYYDTKVHHTTRETPGERYGTIKKRAA